ncbi:glycoside hydrolase family 9 protein [Pelosinus propionicus]|uniref:Endoglucanase n=1 Tax=Pelosinus propionicus DSM 13327 TaxID=1123291 RepID=A0A1I4GYQ1_9FIRM|nr:glycoside hydrolase family 9 protein [Pelosinus propionicus]SFL35069.1 endoglucanase [Pelosinus propionicus DSM 13327]
MKKFLAIIIRVCMLSILIFNMALPAFAAPESSTKIHIDQVGYLPQYPKVAIVVAGKGPKEFKVVNTATNEIAYKGNLSAPRTDNSSKDTVRQADFSAVTTPGTYMVTVDGIGSSYHFTIADNVYNIPFIHTLRSFTLARSNILINDPITGLTNAAGHEKYKTAKVFFTDEVSTAGQILDVSGGWYDAGDFGKYIPTGGVTVANILLAYEAQPEKFNKGQMFFPENLSTVDAASNMPDILIEMKVELDWMLKMQRPDGGVYLKTSGKYWPELKTKPIDDVQNRYIYGLSTYGTAIFGATTAMAARIYEQYDPQYAGILLTSAQKAFAFLESRPEPIFRVDANQNTGSGPYDKTNEHGQRSWLQSVEREYPNVKMTADADDRIWIAAELFKTTGNSAYELLLQQRYSNILTLKPDTFSWMNTLAFGQWAYLTNKHADETLKSKVKDAFLSYADATVKQIAADGYACSLRNDEYTWASSRIAIAKGNMLVLAYQIEPKKQYLYGAMDQVHYILGRNTNGISYLTGAGTKTPQNVHNRIHESTGIAIPGQLVGGPNNWPGGDPIQEKVISTSKMPPAKVYFDVSGSYSTNEYAIDYTAPVTYILSYFSRIDDSLTSEDLKLKTEN